MNAFVRFIDHTFSSKSLWDDSNPVRDELFGVERLEQHAESLALAQTVTSRPPRVRSLHRRLDDNASTLLAAYRASAIEVEGDRGVVPAAEWLLDNYHLVEAQIREIREDLPPGYYRQLPKLANGAFAGYPRVFGLAWAFVAHTDSHFDPGTLSRFVAAYQRIQPLTIGELWAVAITLRIVLIENLRRLADQITIGRATRADADALADQLLAPGSKTSPAWPLSPDPLSERFAAQLAKRLRDHDPDSTPAQGWLEQRLAVQGSSIEMAVQHAQQRQGASNVTIRNIITSMRLISDVDWAELFEGASLVDERLSSASGFAAMDFPTRDLYRSAIEQLARGAPPSELDIAAEALAASHEARSQASSASEAERTGDPGFHLIGQGRKEFEARIGFRAPLRLWFSRVPVQLGLKGYMGALALVTAMVVAATVWLALSQGAPGPWLALFILAALLPATDIAVALVNRAIAGHVGACALPGLELADGVPSTLRTLIAVPTLLTTRADLIEQIERLEVHCLSGAEGDLYFALLADGLDAPQETMAGDSDLIETAHKAIAALNARHGPGPAGDRFIFLYRRRQFNPGEQVWMGWERKRGKLHELNRLLRGAMDTSFVTTDGAGTRVPSEVRYVITLDADTMLPRQSALRLVGKMAHPLNRPRFNDETRQIVDGYGILQPRVTAALPGDRDGSLFQRIFSSPGGMDPYAGAISDIYQDLFGQGSFAGKGIYDVDAFETALGGRIPDNTLLSHDLLEGSFARAGLASDVELVEDFPARYDVAARRAHRWTRGDWQLWPWISGKSGVGAVARWKMLDNLRRTLVAPFSVIALVLAGLLPLPAALAGVALIVAAIAVPALLPVAFSALPRRSGLHMPHHFFSLGEEARLAAIQVVLKLAFLPDEAWRSLDAITRTVYRVFVSRRMLLEWTTAAQSGRRPRLTLAGFYREMASGTAVAIALLSGTFLFAPGGWPITIPLAMLWLAAPAIALYASRTDTAAKRDVLTPSEAKELRLIARRTWRFFETFVTADDNMLPPDNFQDSPQPVIAHRTSPTNIGLYLLSSAAARDFGWTGTLAVVERLEAGFETLGKLEKFNGHLFNWYDTQDLRILEPAYVSSVDSGNLAGHLIALANACEEWIGAPVPDNRTGLADTLDLARLALSGETGGVSVTLVATFDEIEILLGSTQSMDSVSPALMRLAEKALKTARETAGADPEPVFWIAALAEMLQQFARDRIMIGSDPVRLDARLAALAKAARDMALEMDFAFLIDPDRKLLSIGYSLLDNGLDPSCYDLLASEARLASLFAIAKGDAPTRHWFRLGRTATPIGNGSALVSWSGSMFEYLMPSLVMRAPDGSLLERTNRTIVARQIGYAKGFGVPWGISESAYNARDLEFTYQYSNFGVPGLGLKRGLSTSLVIAPYATGLAAMINPRAASENYARLARMGALGPYGFYEALDFTPARVPPRDEFAIVRNVMAHHQGMTIVSILNTLLDGRMRARFHREPMIMASELLLAEKLPREVAVAHVRADELRIRAGTSSSLMPAVRRISGAASDAPVATHMLSNGRYAVMVTGSGAGYSRWRDIAITRWREDATRDDWGAFIYLRDTQSGATWSPSAQPIGGAPDTRSVIFGEDHAEFIRRDGSLTTAMELLVSGEDDGEVRRVSLTNSGRRAREIELTSYAELVLATPASDNAHPAFSKMFVITEYLAEFGALIATRRRRNPAEPEVWAAHFAVVEGEIVGGLQYETDRARFVGRNRTIADPVCLGAAQDLSNTVGTVLDPVFSLRQRVRVLPGKSVRIAFWTMVAASREKLLELIDIHHDHSAFGRAKTLAWTQAQVQLHHLGTSLQQAADFQRLAAPILYADARFRMPAEALAKGIGPQSGLWAHGISGDLPLVVLRIEDVEDMGQVRQLLRAHEYWRMKGLAVDLVIVNERAASYVQDLQSAIETAVRTSQSRPRFGDQSAQGVVHILRADMMAGETRDLVYAVARVVLMARHGPIADQLARLAVPSATSAAVARPDIRATEAENVAMPTDLEFFNGLGGFDRNGTEYVTVLENGTSTPAPWINVIANSGFGFQVSADGSGYTWADNSRENQLTPWSNDPVADLSGEVIYIRDEESGALWSPTARPIRDAGRYVVRHGFGYSTFSHQAHGIESTLTQFVPLADPVKVSRLKLTNHSSRPRRLSVTTYSELVLGTQRGQNAPFITTEIDTRTGAILARNRWGIFPDRVAFADLGDRTTAWTTDRTGFLGRNGSTQAPLALTHNIPLSRATGAGLDACAVQQVQVSLEPGQSIETILLLGQGQSPEAAGALVKRYRTVDPDAMLADISAHWADLLGTVEVETPDRAMDIMLNGWLLYQTLACRITARSAFYQASGAYGFRDQLQDGMALAFARPKETRHHILRAAGRQFVEGDVQHWWLPHSGQGVRTRISDDRVWLAFATATYIAIADDAAILDEPVPFLEGQHLAEGEHDAFFIPQQTEKSSSLFEHCARGLDQAIALSGKHGLPLIGTGDWNDGMNRVGEGGKGESVWLGWLLAGTIDKFVPLAGARDPKRAARWRAHAIKLASALETHAWDGEWYRRATFDDGTWLGSAQSGECRIDSIAQSWAVLSGVADPARASVAMSSLEKHLIRKNDGLALLFAPPFDTTAHDPGYIKGYPPGLRENGGQYSHAAMWAILAFAGLGDGGKAHDLFAMLNPINHADTPEAASRYRVEPYVVAADVYSVAPHAGRGGWTWYTGSAGWMYRAGIEGILGISRQGNLLTVDPVLPPHWPGFRANVRLGTGQYEISIIQSASGIATSARFDGKDLPVDGRRVCVPLDGGAHTLTIAVERTNGWLP